MEMKNLEPKIVFEIFDEINQVPALRKRRRKSAHGFLTLQKSITLQPKPMRSAT